MNGHIRKRKTKSGHTWQVIIDVGVDSKGKRKRIFKSVKGNKKEAEKLLTKLLNEMDTGMYIEESKITLKDYLKDWLKTYVEVNLSPTTLDGYRYNIELHIIPYIGDIPLQQLKPMHIQKLYQTLLKEGRRDGKGGLSAKSVRYVHRNLREALEHALKMEMINRNVADLVTLPKVKAYQVSVYDEDEVLTLLEKARGTDLEVPITLAVILGLRRGEMLGLKWADVDFKNHIFVIRNNLVDTSQGLILKSPKSQKGSRIIDIPETLAQLLKRHKKSQLKNKLQLGGHYQDNDLVCCSNDGSFIPPKYFSQKFSRFLVRNDLKKIRLHDLRHTNATLMLKYGVPAKLASQRLGHSSVGITLDLYSHVIGDMQQEVSDKIEAGILQKIYPG